MRLVLNNKSPFYQVVYFVNGKKTTISTKTTDLEKANNFLNEFQKQTYQVPVQQIQCISLSKFRNEYLEYLQASKSRHYVLSVKTSFKMLINFAGDIPLTRLDLRTLDKFVTNTFSRTQRGAGLYYRTLKAAFSKAVIWNYLPDNPLKKIKAPKISKTFPVFISEVELHTILNNTKEQIFKDIFFTAFYTGMRLGELVNMKWNWIDLNQNIITVKCSDTFTTKSKKERIIPICPALRNVLLNRLPKVLKINTDYFLFSRLSGIKFTEEYISKKFKKIVRAAGLDEKVHFHTLRHSFASILVQRGVSLFVVKELLGHEDLTTTQIYSHLTTENLLSAVNLL